MNRVAVTDDLVLTTSNNKRVGAALPNEVLMSSELSCWVTRSGGSAYGGRGLIGVKCDNPNGTNSYSNLTGGNAYCNAYNKFSGAQPRKYNRDGTVSYSQTCTDMFYANVSSSIENTALGSAYVAEGLSIRNACFRLCEVITQKIDPNYPSHHGTCSWYDGDADTTNPAFAFCSRVMNINRICRDYCGVHFVNELFTSTYTETSLKAEVLPMAERACGLMFSYCTIKTPSDYEACPDSKNYDYDITPVISSVDKDLDAMPYREYNPTLNGGQWEIHMGGANMINIQEFCRAKKESRSR